MKYVYYIVLLEVHNYIFNLRLALLFI